MQKGFVKYWLILVILSFSGYGNLSATTSRNLNELNNSRFDKGHQYTDFSIQFPLSGTEHKIDLAENEIEEDESDLPVRPLENYIYSPVSYGEPDRLFISDNRKYIPFYLIFCIIRI